MPLPIPSPSPSPMLMELMSFIGLLSMVFLLLVLLLWFLFLLVLLWLLAFLLLVVRVPVFFSWWTFAIECMIPCVRIMAFPFMSAILISVLICFTSCFFVMVAVSGGVMS